MKSQTEDSIPETSDPGSHWRSAVSQISSAKITHFPPLSPDESKTFRQWRTVTLAFYGAIVIFAILLSIAIGPPESTAAKNNPAYSAIASRGQNNPAIHELTSRFRRAVHALE